LISADICFLSWFGCACAFAPIQYPARRTLRKDR
jgi:hypothetical protein